MTSLAAEAHLEENCKKNRDGYWRRRQRGTPKDLTGETYESLTVVEYSHRDTDRGRHFWKCRCNCGNEIVLSTGEWNMKSAKSCGCYRLRKGKEHPNYRHGVAEARRRTDLRKNYGITFEQYDAMFANQNGVCAICGSAGGKKKLHVDHCHTTGKIRGLLCINCNHGLGHFKDNEKLMLEAIKYLANNGG